MKSTTRTKPQTPPKESSAFIGLLSGWAQQGVESFFATQHILQDLAIRQNASVMHLLREQLSDPHHSSAKLLSELTGDGVTNFIEAQKVLLDLAQQQNKIVMTGVKERLGASARATATASVLQRSIESFIEMQQDFLKIAGRQTHAWLEAAETGKPFNGEHMVELAREGTENFVRAQKRFLDIVAEETQSATGEKRTHGAGKKAKQTDLSELTRQAVDSFVNAQKKLFDLAGHQLNVNVKAVGKVAPLLRPFPFVPLADLTREAVKSYADASKALMDVLLKGRNGHTRETKTEHRAKHPVGHVHSEAAHTVVA
jgi:hypothetical protein